MAQTPPIESDIQITPKARRAFATYQEIARVAEQARMAREGAKRMARAARDTARALARMEAECERLGIGLHVEPQPRKEQHGQ